ncbi:MAG: amidohydrolase family protein, partial [Burkholderiales bacterium]
HALPPEFAQRPDAWIDEIVQNILPEVARLNLADAVDAFCETIGFTPAQTRRVFKAARSQWLPVKLHAEQLSNQGGAVLAAEFGALSADHLEHVDEAGVRAMAASGTVAVMLPGAYYFLRDTQVPPIALFREHGVAMAVATDCNPGTSPTTHLPLMMNMACTLFRMTPAEALLGVTRIAAKALGLSSSRGTITLGKRADLCLWDVDHPAELSYAIGSSPLRARIQHGVQHPLQ